MNPIHAVILVLLPAITLAGTLDALGGAQIVGTPSTHAPALVGLPIYLQCAVFTPGGQIRLSNGAVRFFQ